MPSESDDILVSTLAAVVKANVEYAKGVSELLSADSLRRQEIESMSGTLDEILDRLIELEEKQKEILSRLEMKLCNRDCDSLNSKFKPLYVSSGLKEDGSEYSPSDNLILSIRKAITSKIAYLIGGAILVYLAKLIGTWGLKW